MRLEGAILLSHAEDVHVDAGAEVVKDGFLFRVFQENGAATEQGESPSGMVTLQVFPHEESGTGRQLLEKLFEVEPLLSRNTNEELKNTLFDCLRFLERVFGLEDESWRPLL